MLIQKKFLVTAIFCCFLSVITTIGIHSNLFDLGDLSFEDRLYLYENKTYLANRFWVICHCLFVLISMWGFCLIQFKKSPGFAGLGFVFFTVFSFTEIFRQMFVFFYLNGLRQRYLEADEAIQKMLEFSMDNAGLLAYGLFGLFIVAFSLGNICYGITLIGKRKIDNGLAYLLLLWGFGNLMAFGNEFWGSTSLNSFLETFSLIYQPIMRLLLGLWLFLKLREIDIVRNGTSTHLLKHQPDSQ